MSIYITIGLSIMGFILLWLISKKIFRFIFSKFIEKRLIRKSGVEVITKEKPKLKKTKSKTSPKKKDKKNLLKEIQKIAQELKDLE